MKDILLAIYNKYKDVTNCPACNNRLGPKIIGEYLACCNISNEDGYKDGYECFHLGYSNVRIRITNNIILAISLNYNKLILFETINEKTLFETNLDNIDKSRISTTYPFIDKDYLETMLLFI